MAAGPKRQSGWKTTRHSDSLFSSFIRDFARVWAEEGLDAVRKVAKKSPEAFVAIAARICPNDIRLTLEQAIPGGMTLEDYSLMREVIAAIRKLARCRPIAARSSISVCAEGAARLSEEYPKFGQFWLLSANS
jgi:hypothetical protein